MLAGQLHAARRRRLHSAIIDSKIFATLYAFWGGVFLTALVHFQLECNKGFKALLALTGSKLLAVPLILPLGALHSDVYHVSFAIAGFAVELLYVLTVWYELQHTLQFRRRPGAWIITVSAVVSVGAFFVMLSSFLALDKTVSRNGIIIGEYLFGASLLATVEASEYYKFY